MADKDCDRAIKKIEAAMTVNASTEKIGSERSNRSKSMYVWFDDPNDKIKLEICRSNPMFMLSQELMELGKAHCCPA